MGTILDQYGKALVKASDRSLTAKESDPTDIVTVPLYQMDDDAAYEYVKTNYDYAYEAKLDAFTANLNYRKIYEGLDAPELVIDESSGMIEDDERLYPNAYLPVVSARVESGVAQSFNAIFSSPDYIRGEATDDLDDIAVQSKIIPHMIATHRQIGFRYKVYRALLNAACFDYGVTFGYWQVEPGYIPDRQAFLEDVQLGSISLQRRRIEVEMKWVPDKIDRFSIDNISYHQCAHDPDAKFGFEDSEYFFDWRWEQFGKLKGGEMTEERPYGRYYNLDKVKAMLLAKQPVRPQNESHEDNSDEMVRRTRIKVVRCGTPYHVVEAVIGDDDGVIISREDTFDWIYHLWRWSHRDNSFRGMGIPDRLERSQYDINAAVNDRRAASNWQNDPPKIIDQRLLNREEGSVKVHHGKLFIRPTSTPVNLRSDDMLTFAKVGDGGNSGNTMTETQMEMQVINDLSGVNENSLNQYSTGRRSATQTQAVEAHRAGRFGVIVELIEEQAVEKIYMQQFLYCQLYMTRMERFKHYGKHGEYGLLVTPEDYKLTGGVRFTAMGATAIRDDAVHNQQLLALWDRALVGRQMGIQIPLEKLWEMVSKALVPMEYYKLLPDANEGAENIPPDLENQIMAMGSSLETSPKNDDAAHMKSHLAYKMTPDYKYWPEARKRNMDIHNEKHQAKMMQQMAQASAGRSNSLNPTSANAMQGIRPPEIGVTP